MQFQKDSRFCDSLRVRGRLAALIVLVSLHATAAFSQVSATYDTLESKIVESTSVFRGAIVQLERQFVRAADVEGLPSLADDLVRYTFTIKVRESYKGKPGPTVKLARETYDYDKRLPQWHAERTSLLWFVHWNENRDTAADHRAWNMIRLGKPVPAEEIFKQVAPPIFSMDLSVLRTSRSMVRAARDFSSRYPQANDNHEMTIPRALAERCSASGDANFLVIPVLAPLERIAHTLINSPHEVLPSSTELDVLSRLQLREAGVHALQYFKSDENIKLLSSLLNDPTVIHHTFDFGPRKGTRVREFLIRRTAYELLREWGVKVDKPILEEILGEAP